MRRLASPPGWRLARILLALLLACARSIAPARAQTSPASGFAFAPPVAPVLTHTSGPGAEVASTSVITKLLRVFLLEPWIIALYYLGIGQKQADKGGAKAGKGVPWFAFGFVAVATVNSIWGIAPSLQKLFTTLSAGFLASAMAALGLDTDLVKVRTRACS